MSPKENAKRITDKLYQLQIKAGKVPCIELAKIEAELICEEVISELPMYNNELNPKWEFWDGTRNELLNI